MRRARAWLRRLLGAVLAGGIVAVAGCGAGSQLTSLAKSTRTVATIAEQSARTGTDVLDAWCSEQSRRAEPGDPRLRAWADCREAVRLAAAQLWRVAVVAGDLAQLASDLAGFSDRVPPSSLPARVAP